MCGRMPLFRKKPVVIEAVQLSVANSDEVCAWAGGSMGIAGSQNAPSGECDMRLEMLIPTLEGQMIGSLGDWIIKGVNGEFYPCKPDIFAKTYEPVDSEPELTLPSAHQLGATVTLFGETGTVIGVRFAVGKVTYDVELHVGGEMLGNVDSTFVS